jgi:hypothetical protein
MGALIHDGPTRGSAPTSQLSSFQACRMGSHREQKLFDYSHQTVSNYSQAHQTVSNSRKRKESKRHGSKGISSRTAAVLCSLFSVLCSLYSVLCTLYSKNVLVSSNEKEVCSQSRTHLLFGFLYQCFMLVLEKPCRFCWQSLAFLRQRV